jgi:hypothetical protein
LYGWVRSAAREGGSANEPNGGNHRGGGTANGKATFPHGAAASEAFFDLYRQARPIHLSELA